MRETRRERGRYASLSGMRVIKGDPGDAFPLLIVDRQGLLVPHAAEYYRLRLLECEPRSTTDTYLGHLLPVLSFLSEAGRDWAAPPREVRQSFFMFLRQELHCTVSPDTDLDGFRYAVTKETPVSESTLRGIVAALRDFYRLMRRAGYYAHENPFESALLRELNRVRARALENAGAPDHAGIRSEPWAASGRRPSAFFRAAKKADWSPDMRIGLPAVVQGLADAADCMMRDPRLSLRDRAVIGLLRHTGARASEITDMTVGGYRSFTRDGILGEARVKNKGSGGVEEKRIDFGAATDLQDTLRRYIEKERPRLDPDGRKRLADVSNDAPLFLTSNGTPYGCECFKWHWRKVYPQARKLCPVDFSPHDLRHLLVTELLIMARERWDKGNPDYADQKRVIATGVMWWADPSTIEVYDHSVDKVDALGLLADLQRRIGERGRKIAGADTQTHHAAPAPTDFGDDSGGDDAGPGDRCGDESGGLVVHPELLDWFKARARQG